jgi:hypothetical protein
MLRYVFEREGMQTEGRTEARKWPVGFEEEKCSLATLKGMNVCIEDLFFFKTLNPGTKKQMPA